MSRQILLNHKDIRQAVKSTEQFVEDYSAIKEDLESVTVGFKPLFGAGSPEGVVTSNRSQVYFDTTNTPTNVTMYVNETVGVNTNWVQVV